MLEIYYDNMDRAFIDLEGKPVKLNKYDYPYSYDAYVQWKSNDYIKGSNETAYSDRLLQWDYEKFNKCTMKVWGNESQWFNQRDSKDIEKFLSLYFEKNIRLSAVIEGCNASNGYPYWVFIYQELK